MFYFNYSVFFISSDCANGQYIVNRQCLRCKGHCKIGTYCNKLTGRCDDGCEAQWSGEFCERKNATRYTNTETVENIEKSFNQKPMHLFQHKEEHVITHKQTCHSLKKNRKKNK